MSDIGGIVSDKLNNYNAIDDEGRSRGVDPEPGRPALKIGREEIHASDCFQCGRCSAGCTMAEVTDLLPHQLVRLHQLGQREALLRAEHLWLCTGCGTCSTRCPNQVPVAELVDRLKTGAYRAGRGEGASRAEQFHALFHDSVRRYGRNHELGLVRRLKTTRELMQDLRTGMKLWRRGKLRLRPQKVRDRCAIEQIYERARGVGS